MLLEIVCFVDLMTALDAAGPLFENYPEAIRIDPSDALFVDAVHTDGDDFYMVVIGEGGLCCSMWPVTVKSCIYTLVNTR